jgi:hypothetical protein
MSGNEPDRDIAKILLETDLADRAMARGVREALLLHKRLGAPIAVWKDDRVQWIPAAEIEIPPEEEPAEGAP